MQDAQDDLLKYLQNYLTDTYGVNEHNMANVISKLGLELIMLEKLLLVQEINLIAVNMCSR